MKVVSCVVAAFALLFAGGLQLQSLARDGSEREADEKDQSLVGAREEATRGMLAAAEKTLEATKAGYDAGTAPLGDLFIWSRHVLDVRQKLAKTKEDRQQALLTHWRFMKQTNAKVGALYRAGSKGGEVERYFATKYYLAEAERWLAEAGLTPPK